VVTYLVRQPQVHYVTRAAVVESFALRADNHDRRRLDVETASVVGVDAAQAHGLLGNGIVVGISDSGLYMDHDQFDQPSPREFDAINLDARKVVLYQVLGDRVDQSDNVTCGHGTHVSGILAGSSYSQDHPNVGIAPHVKIAFTDLGVQNASCANQPGLKCPVSLKAPSNPSSLMGQQQEAGAKIFSYSWGTVGDDYSKQAMNLDQFLFDNPELLIVIAAGNAGESGERTISSPAGAKNVLTVGASLNTIESLSEKYNCTSVYNPDTVAAFSSQGPTSDGRIKPEVVAPGQIITSARSEASTSTAKTSALCPLQGTSQATPVISGFAVLLTEWLRDGWYANGTKDTSLGMKTIPSALLKALIVHSAHGLQRRLTKTVKMSCKFAAQHTEPLAYPDFRQGFGLPNMSNLAFFDGAAPSVVFYPNGSQPSPSLAHGGAHVYTHTLRPGDTFRATLVWTDPPGSLLSTRMLQNDLDLYVHVLDPRYLAPNGLRTLPLTVDTRNNVEMVQLSYVGARAMLQNATDDPIEIEIRVAGTSVLLHAPQPYALVLSTSSTEAMEAKKHRDEAQSGVLWERWATACALSAAAVLGGLVLCRLTRPPPEFRRHEAPVVRRVVEIELRPIAASETTHLMS
ncbi:hypothetical protein As57867_008125, partial [Aphanomyces stellatus]